MSNASYDPWDSAMNAQPRVYTNEVYGSATIEVEPVVLVKGVGKVPFNPGAHKEEERVTAISLSVTPLIDSKFTDVITRDMLAESGEWTKITLPSIKALGVSGLRELNGKYVKAKLVPTGQKFTGRDGAEKEKTTFSFIAVYSNEQDCRAAFHANGAGDSEPVAAPAANGNSEKDTAAKFLAPIVENCCRGAKDKAEAKSRVAVTIATMPVVNKHFTADSPEVAALIDKVMGG